MIAITFPQFLHIMHLLTIRSILFIISRVRYYTLKYIYTSCEYSYFFLHINTRVDYGASSLGLDTSLLSSLCRSSAYAASPATLHDVLPLNRPQEITL